jgi:hypothetical protein
MEGGDQQSTQGQTGGHWQYKPEAPVQDQPVQDDAPLDQGPPVDYAAPQPQTPAAPAPGSPHDMVTWTASEFVAHHKNVGWYFMLVLAMGAASALLYLITHDAVSVVAVVILAVVFGVSAGRKPRILNYQLDRSGLTIGQRFYGYGNFKSFSLVNEGAFTSIMFMPLKRFMPAVSIYFSPEDEEKIIEVLSAHLPLQQGSQDAIDRLMHRIRF